VQRVERGRRGERIAAAYLELIGYRVLRTNYRIGPREIDLIAQIGRTIVFVEVKLRAGRESTDVALAVDHRKRRRLVEATGRLIGRLHRRGWRARYDVVAIALTARGLTLRHFPGAFAPPASFVG
jgi:putative endonuclease